MVQQPYVDQPHVSIQTRGSRGKFVLAPRPNGGRPDGLLAAVVGLRVRLPTNTEPVQISSTGSGGQRHEKRTHSRSAQNIELLHYLGT